MKALQQEQVRGKNWRDLDALHTELTTFFEITYNQLSGALSLKFLFLSIRFILTNWTAIGR